MAGLGLIAGTNPFQFKEKYDALKANDQKQLLAYPNKRKTEIEAQQKELTSLTTLLGTFKGDISSFIDGDAFSKTKVDTTGESASLTTKKGVNIKDFSIDVKQLATKDAYQTNSFKSETYGIFNDIGIYNDKGEKQMIEKSSFTVAIGEKEFTINVDSSDSLQSLSDKLLSATDKDGNKLSDHINTKVLDVGHDNYKLMITSKEAGIDNAITFKVDSNAKDPNTAKFSEAVLKKLGLLDSANASKANSELKAANEQLDASKVILGDKNYLEEIEKKISELTDGKELTYKVFVQDPSSPDKTIEKEEKFTVNKDTDLTKLSQAQLKAVFNEFKDKTNEEQQIKDWVAYIKNTGEELNISYKDGDNTKTVSINVATDYNSLDEKQKNAIKDFYNQSQENYFNNEINVKAAQSKVDSVDDSKNHVQKAQDSKFIYNGVEISRSTNSIDDLILGAKISLKKEGLTSFKVENDIDDIVENFNTFTKNYNSIVNSLALSTGFDKDTKKAGALQGVSEISRLKSQLSSLITKVDENGMSLSRLGFELNEKGILSFKSSEFKEAFKEDGEKITQFLKGNVEYKKLNYTSKTIETMPALANGDLKINGKSIVFDKDFLKKLDDKKVTQNEYINTLVQTINNTKIEGISAILGKDGNIIIESSGEHPLEISGNTEKLLNLGLEENSQRVIKNNQQGVFAEFQDTLNSLIGSDGSLKKLDEQLSDDTKKINEDIKKINKDIETRYDMLAQKLNSYDKMINKYTMMGQQINAMIEAAYASK